MTHASVDKGQRVTPPPPWAGNPIHQERQLQPTHSWLNLGGGNLGGQLVVCDINRRGGGGCNQTTDSKIKKDGTQFGQ